MFCIKHKFFSAATFLAMRLILSLIFSFDLLIFSSSDTPSGTLSSTLFDTLHSLEESLFCLTDHCDSQSEFRRGGLMHSFSA